MGFTNSKLAAYTKLSPHCNSPRNQNIKRITPHHAAGNVTLETLAQVLINSGISANYCISQGRIGLTCEEKNRAWTSSSPANDHGAITVEIANSANGGNWPIRDEDIEAFIDLATDVCQRNGIPNLYYDGTPNATLTLHKFFSNTGCPGPYFLTKIDYICNKVNARLNGSTASLTPDTPAVTPSAPPKQAEYTVITTLKGYNTAADAVHDINARVTVVPGTYYIFNQTTGAVNVSKSENAPGAWINKSLNVAGSTSASTTTVAAIPSQNKTLEQVAREVISGQWGNGNARIASLTSAGYIASNVQTAVNSILAKQPVPNLSLYIASNNTVTAETVKSLEYIAREVIGGKWGNDPQRTQKLTAAGYIAANVQAAVNALLKNQPVPQLPLSASAVAVTEHKSNTEIAQEVIAGKWGNGAQRINRLTAAGYDAAAVQAEVNILLK